jgi:DNA-directed RNA polymerase subunit M/transcription elongation factor TFIIS
MKDYYHSYNEANRERISARNRKRLQEHGDEVRAKSRQYYAENRDRERAANRKYYQEHRDELRRKMNASAVKRRLENPEDARRRGREYYAKNRIHYRQRVNERKRAKIRTLNEYKATLKCSTCGEAFPDHPSVIEFHHTGRDLKEDTIGALMGEGPSSERLRAELAKCIPLCANCHRRLHYFEAQKKRAAGGLK